MPLSTFMLVLFNHLLRKDLDMTPYKVQLLQELKPPNVSQNRLFVEWSLGKLIEDPFLLENYLQQRSSVLVQWVDMSANRIYEFDVKSSQGQFKSWQYTLKDAVLRIEGRRLQWTVLLQK